MEQQSRKRKKRADIQRLVLQTVGTAGLIGVALVAPNVLGMMGKLGVLPNRRHKDSIHRARNTLVQKGYLRWENRKLCITETGKKELERVALRNYVLPKPKRWDGRWRVLIFDIPERRKGLRRMVRHALKAVGFIRLQNSVWVYPYDCEEFITLFKTESKIGKDLLYMIVDTLEYDIPIRTRFGLE